jgi:putative DNA primase/helicase
VKLFVGGDTLTARAPYGRFEISFRPTHTLFLLTNPKPRADASDYALWQRIHLIPFTLCFVDEPQADNERRRDPGLLDKLKAEASGILAWLVQGCKAWQKEGLNPPEAVRAATKSYRADEDLFGQFLEQACTFGERCEVKAGELYKAYRQWSEDMGLKPKSGRKFGEYMKAQHDSYQDYRGVFYLGVGLLAPVNDSTQT